MQPITIAGQRIPPVALIAGAGILILLFLRRSGGGPAPAPAGAAFDPSLSYMDAISGLGSQIQGLQGAVEQLSTQPAPAPAPMSPPPLSPPAGLNPTEATYHGEFHEVWIDPSGTAIQSFYTPGKGWATQQLGSGFLPSSQAQVSVYNDEFHVLGTLAGGGLEQLWYDPHSGQWASQQIPGSK